ncbi:MAG: M1 family aminopeptidase, partial [Bacteroidota bacterium]
AIAYGNEYQNGYRGRDLSGTGHGLLWDFIVIHEAGHEWFGNNISTDDIADMWVHESFTNYSENLFTECQQGRDAGAAYVIGTRANVQNDKPIVGPYGVNQRGSGDMYYKGGNMLHTIRHIIADDDQWRAILRGLNETFGKKTVTGLDVQRYMSSTAGIALDKVFEQYLTTTQIPVFEYRLAGPTLWYRWTNTVDQFDMPLDVQLTDAGPTRLYPTAAWQTVPATFVRVDQDFYVDTRRVE